MSGILDVARAAGVSPATVSRVLRGLPGASAVTAARVRVAADQLGYVASPMAAALAGGRTRTVGVLAPWVTRWFFGAVIEGATPVFAANGYDVLLHADPSFSGHATSLRSLGKRLDGVLALSVPITADLIAPLAAGGTQLVTVGPAPASVPSVSVDDVAVGRTAAEHLLALGHQRIGFVGGVAGRYPDEVADNRVAGVRQALTAHGLDGDAMPVTLADFTIDGGERAAAQLVAGPCALPTGVVAVSDEVAVGLVHGLRQRGIAVPGRVSVVGVDDHDIAHVLGLTTVAQPVRAQGQLAAAMLVAVMAGDTAKSVVLPTELVVRQTSSPPTP